MPHTWARMLKFPICLSIPKEYNRHLLQCHLKNQMPFCRQLLKYIITYQIQPARRRTSSNGSTIMNIMEIRQLWYNNLFVKWETHQLLYVGLHSKPQRSYPLSVTWATIWWRRNKLHRRWQGYSCHQQQFPIPAQGPSSQLHYIWSPVITKFNQPTNSPWYHDSLTW